ncbi:MAG: hypothetical protein WCL70_05630 [Paludibacter sp.]
MQSLPKYFTAASLLFILILTGCMGNLSESPYPDITFTPKSVMPGIGRASAVGFAIDGKGYVALGRTGIYGPQLKDCWEFNPDSDKWSQKAVFPGKARVKAVGVGLNGKGFVGMGFDIKYAFYVDTAHLKDFWCFDPKLNTWTRKADYPSKYTDACISMVYKNEIYVGFGFDGWGFSRYFFKYNPENDIWIELNGFPGPERVGGVMCTDGERVFFGTGFNTYNQNDWWEYFPATDTWKELLRMPDTGRENGLSISIKDKNSKSRYFVTTGRRFAGEMTGGGVKSDIMEYDPIRTAWYKRGDIPNGGRENALIFAINGKGYVGFGENSNTVYNDFWCFEP